MAASISPMRSHIAFVSVASRPASVDLPVPGRPPNSISKPSQNILAPSVDFTSCIVSRYTTCQEGGALNAEGRRAATTAATRRGIVDAAREILATQQWQHFTVEAVANRAGVTRMTVYNQVGSKRGLLNAVLTDLTQRAGMDQLLTETQHL